MAIEWSIQDIARMAGTTSRTLRHYGDVGLLAPSRIGMNGYRFYDEAALVRLQRILLLRELGLGIPAIGTILEGHSEDADALGSHLRWLEQEKSRLDRQIASVESTIHTLKEGRELMAEQMFDGFDHTRYREEVIERWGEDEYASGDAWWRAMSEAERETFSAENRGIAAAYAAARAAGAPADSAEVQAIVARHVAWLEVSVGGSIPAERLRGYGDLYVGDPRFAANYGGQDGAEFVRAALYAAAELTLQ